MDFNFVLGTCRTKFIGIVETNQNYYPNEDIKQYSIWSSSDLYLGHVLFDIHTNKYDFFKMSDNVISQDRMLHITEFCDYLNKKFSWVRD